MNELLTDNPSLRGMVMGYAAEIKARKQYFEGDSRVTGLTKYDDHDRTKKGDISFHYAGHEFSVEVKSLQTAMIKPIGGGTFTGKFQCDASDRRIVTFPNGTTIETTLLLVGEFDLLAVNLFGFTKQWTFAFAKNEDLPRCTQRSASRNDYTEHQRERLLASLMPITWPLQPPYTIDPWPLLDELVQERRAGTEPDIDKDGIRVETKKKDRNR